MSRTIPTTETVLQSNAQVENEEHENVPEASTNSYPVFGVENRSLLAVLLIALVFTSYMGLLSGQTPAIKVANENVLAESTNINLNIVFGSDGEIFFEIVGGKETTQVANENVPGESNNINLNIAFESDDWTTDEGDDWTIDEIVDGKETTQTSDPSLRPYTRLSLEDHKRLETSQEETSVPSQTEEEIDTVVSCEAEQPSEANRPVPCEAVQPAETNRPVPCEAVQPAETNRPVSWEAEQSAKDDFVAPVVPNSKENAWVLGQQQKYQNMLDSISDGDHIVLQVNASKTGYGALLFDSRDSTRNRIDWNYYFSGEWGEDDGKYVKCNKSDVNFRGFDSNCGELKAVYKTLSRTLPLIRGKNVTVITDSDTTKKCIKGKRRANCKNVSPYNQQISNITKDILDLCKQNAISLTAQHVKREINTAADYLSKLRANLNATLTVIDKGFVFEDYDIFFPLPHSWAQEFDSETNLRKGKKRILVFPNWAPESFPKLRRLIGSAIIHELPASGSVLYPTHLGDKFRLSFVIP